MKAAYDTTAGKRPVNITLNEDLVVQVRAMTGNFSAVVEALLGDFLAKEKQHRAADRELAKQTAATWNRFAEQHGSFADEYSTL